MPDLRISELAPVGAAALAATDPLALADLSASETKKVTVKDLLQGGIAFIDDGSIPGSKISATVPPGAIGTVELADKSVTAIKLADNSTVLVQASAPATGIYVGQLLLDTDDDKVYCWNGNAWVPIKAAGSINSIIAGDDDVLELTIVITDDVATIVPSVKDATEASLFVAGPPGSPGAVSLRAIAPDDLPRGTNTTVGAVSAPAGGGLRIEDPSSTGQNADIVIDNDITASLDVNHLVTYSEKGLVLSGRPIIGTDLPDATQGSSGVIKAGLEFTVDPTGTLKHSNQIAAGTAPKVSYDGQGHVKAGMLLDVDDIPDLPADKITSGEIGPGLLADCAVTGPKICDYATCLMQEDNPGAGDFLGQFWFTPSTAQLRVYARGSGPENIWLPVGFGALQANNLRWGGTYDADTDTIVRLTAIGTSEGLTAGQLFPASTDALSGIYFICEVAGANCSQPSLDTITHTAGDWAVCLDEVQGWVHIDANAGGGGGGGGGAQVLNDLLDVTIGGGASPFSTNPTVTLGGDQILRYDGSAGVWRNTDIIDGGSID
jgi:hypothetical protein